MRTTGNVFWHYTILDVAVITYKKRLYWLVGHKEINLTWPPMLRDRKRTTQSAASVFSSDLVQDQLIIN